MNLSDYYLKHVSFLTSSQNDLTVVRDRFFKLPNYNAHLDVCFVQNHQEESFIVRCKLHDICSMIEECDGQLHVGVLENETLLLYFKMNENELFVNVYIKDEEGHFIGI